MQPHLSRRQLLLTPLLRIAPWWGAIAIVLLWPAGGGAVRSNASQPAPSESSTSESSASQSSAAAIASHRHLATQLAFHRALAPRHAVGLLLNIEPNLEGGPEAGKLLAVENPQAAGTMLRAPGSTLKPLLLKAALDSGAIAERDRIFCRRTLTLAGRRVDCVHAQVNVAFAAREALANSCNTYFAELAARMSGQQLVEILRRAGLESVPHLLREERTGTIRVPDSIASRQLLALGLEGIAVSPAQLAAAYRDVALETVAASGAPGSKDLGNKAANSRLVGAALEDSVRYGMAHQAFVDGLRVAGKTGTASDALSLSSSTEAVSRPGSNAEPQALSRSRSPASSHGWFVGYAPADRPKILVLVFLEHGRGTDAAALAQQVFRAFKDEAAP